MMTIESFLGVFRGTFFCFVIVYDRREEKKVLYKHLMLVVGGEES